MLITTLCCCAALLYARDEAPRRYGEETENYKFFWYAINNKEIGIAGSSTPTIAFARFGSAEAQIKEDQLTELAFQGYGTQYRGSVTTQEENHPADADAKFRFITKV